MPDKKYLIEIPDMPDSSGIWDSDKWERNKDKFMQKYPTANVFELGQYDENDTDENDQFMLTFDNDADSSGVWDAAKWERNKEAFVAKYPEAHVDRVRYVDYWGNKAQNDKARMEELQQPDEARNAKLAELGYYDDITGGQMSFDLNAPGTIGLKPLSSAIKQNSVSGETTYLDPKVEEFFANDTAHTERQMEMNRLREEYDRNPRVIEQREYEAQMARYAADLEKQIKADMESEVDMVKAARGASAKHQFGADMTSDQMGYLLDKIAGDEAGSGAEENEKLERYNSALKLLQQAKDAREVAGKGLGGGIADTAKDWVRNAATQSDIEMYNEIGNILTSLENKVGNLNEVSAEDIENNLSNDEKALIRAFFEYNAAMADAGQNMSTWYKGGKIFAESIPFMLEFLVTGGLATGAGRAATSWMGKGFAKWIANSAKGTLARTVKKGVAKSVSGVAKTMVAAGARTLVAPSTYNNIAEQSVRISEDGHLDRGGNMVKAAVDSYIEQLSEMSGAAFGEVLGGIGRLALGKTAFDKIGAWFGNNVTMQALSRLGFHGLPEEVGEEIFGNALRTITGVDKEALSRMFEKDEFASMIIGFAPMTLIGAGTSAAQMGAVSIGAANAGRRMRQDLSRSYTEEQIDQVVMSLDAAKDANQITEAIKPIITGMAASGAPMYEIQSVWDYAIAVAKKKAMISAQSVQEMQLTEAKIGEVRDQMGERFWIENEDGTRDVKQVTLNNGNTAYVVSKPDQDGRVAIINADTGQKGTALPEDIKEESWNGTLNAFGAGLVMADRTLKEQQRMQEERKAQITEVQKRLSVDPRINVGTEGSPINLVAQSFNDAGVRYVAQDGSVGNLSWEQAADSIGMPIRVKTDAQIAREEADALVAAAAERRAKRAKKDEVGATERNNAVEDTENAAADANEAERHVPMNEDGTVNEAAFWEQNPEEYVKWNDEQNQDGGQDSLQQIAIARQELMGLLQEANAAQNTSNPTTRKAAKKEVERLADRIARLDAIEQSYMQSLEEEKAAVQQTAATPTATMSEEDLESMDAQYQGILGKTRVQGERVRVMQEYLDKLAEGSVPVVLITRQNYEQKLKEDGLPSFIINKVKQQVDAGKSVAGFMARGKVYLMEDGLLSIEEARVTYVHERQHTFNSSNPQLVQRVANALGNEESALAILKSFVKGKGIDSYKDDDLNALADEIICRSMEVAYTTEDFSVDLQSRGIPSEVISIIAEIDNEQRQDQSLSHARRRSRRNSHADVSGAGSVREDGRDFEQVSEGILEQEEARPSGASGRGAQIGEGAEVISDDEEELNSSDDDVLAEEGFEVDEQNEDVRFSVRFLPTPEQRKGIIDSIINVTGRTRDEAERWLASELSLASIVLNDKEYLDYAPDSKYKAIKDNSDYPQGTVDFNNICRKRKDFTQMYTRLQRSYPNRIFTAEDLADIRTIMSEDGLVVACGLCYVEDRRQKLGEVADEFIKDLQDGFKAYGKKNATKRANAEKFLTLIGEDTYVPTIYDLITLEGSDRLHDEHRGIWEAFGAYNRARGQQTQNTFQGYAEYKREILTWSDAKVKKVNSLGGLRIFSYSDFEAHHLLDIIQIIIDCAARGVMIQGYTKVPEFARVVEKTGIKLNRSLIPLGDTGIVDGKLAYDPVEGIDINDPNFLESNDNVGNILIGINDEQIRMAMADPFIHYIIPYHARQAGNIRAKLNVGAWTNYIDTQNERKMSDGKRVEKNINIYTDVLNESITNDTEFVERYLEVCREKGYIPKFDQFLNRDAEGNYVYTPGYYKFLVDFKLFDEAGNILPQKPVVAQFDDAFNAQVLNDYAREERETAGAAMNSTYDKIVETLDLGEPTEGEDIRFSVKDSEGPIDLVEEARKAQAKHDAKAKKGTKKSEVSFRITAEQDKAYMDAVKAGDMETAQRMVMEAARLAMPNTKVVDENGNPRVVYHGSTAMFTVFDKSRIGSATGTADGRGFYFTTDRDYAVGYKTPDGQLFEVFLNIEKPLSYDKKTITKTQLRKILKEADRVEYEQEGEHYMLSNYANYNDVGIDGAVNEGANLEYDYADNDVELVGSLIGGSGSFDLIMDAVKKVTGKSGMIAPKDNGTVHYVVTNPAAIKSAEPVTYDNDGNVIPLSERFNPENEDIRFRVTEEQRDEVQFRVISDALYEEMDDMIESLVGASFFRRVEGEFDLGKKVKNFAEFADLITIIKNNDNYISTGSSLLGFFSSHTDQHFPLLLSVDDKALRKQAEADLKEALSQIDDTYILFYIKEAWKAHKNGLAQAGLGVKPNATAKFNKAIDARIEEIRAGRVNGTSFNFKKQEVSLDEIDTLFKQLNTNEELAVLHDKVMDLAKRFGVKPQFAAIRGAAEGESLGDKVRYDYRAFNSPAISDERKANIITHELIHSVTSYAFFLDDYMPSALTPEMREAIAILRDVYSAIRRDNAFKDEYGASSVEEMVAELSNTAFREKLKEKSLYQRILDAILKLFGVVKEDSAYNAANEALTYIIENYDENAFNLYSRHAARSQEYAKWYNPEDVRFRMSNDNQAIFVSNAARAVEGIKQEKATPEQWLKMIEKNGGLKAGEDKWMGLSDWLKASDKKTLTKQEVLDFIEENMIIIEEQHYSDEEVAASAHKELNDKYPGWEDAFSMEWDTYMDEPYASIWDNETAVELYNDTHEDQIELDEDGEFENLDDESKVMDFGKELAEIYYRGNSDVRPIHGTRSGYQTRGLSDNHEIALTVPTIERWKADDAVHFGDAGDGRAIAWIRFGETKYRPAGIADEIAALDKAIFEYEGETSDEEYKALVEKKHSLLRASRAQKVLVIDEIQSKRHQEGREKGYFDIRDRKAVNATRDAVGQAAKARDDYKQMLDEKYGVPTTLKSKMASKEEIAELKRLRAEVEKARAAMFEAQEKANIGGIPDAPFDKNWHELAMKRMLRYAAENGYDVIAWTKGDQQNQRYDLGGKVETIARNRVGENQIMVHIFLQSGRKIIIIVDNEGKNAQGNEDFVGKDLAEILGKEWANKVLSAEDGTEFSGDGLSVGGEGMRGFYDKMLPAFMRKYGKKWGVTVEDINLPNLGKSGYTMHSVPVTEEMKASVMEGQVMFRTTAITPEVQDEMNAIHASAIVMGNFMKAPNGQPTNLTEEQWLMVRTKSFKEWFGDWENDPENASKVVDENGEPKVVFHGGAWRPLLEEKGNAVFKMRSGLMGRGAYFTDNFTNAADYAREKYEWENYQEVDEDFVYDNGYITEAFLNIRNEDDIREYYGETFYLATSPNQIKSATDNTGEFSEGEGDIRFKVVTDPAKIEELESGEKIKVYRAMQLIDGKLYPPMSAKVDGQLREPIELGQWEEAEERPDLADNKGYFKLDKGNKKSLKARYNPYFHTSYTPLNDQFSEAQDRPNLVTVEVEIPVSELTSGYKADKAKDSVGEKEWKAGVIQGKLSGTRKVILSRWDKPIRIVPDSEVADVIVKMFEGKDIVMPSNVVTPSLRAELESRGVPFVETDNQGKKLTNIAEMTTPIWSSKGTFANLAEAEEWAHKNLQGKSRVNRYTGERISIGSNSISKMLSPKAQKQSSSISAHLAALKSVLDFIKTGIPAEVHADQEGRDFNVLRLYNAIEIDNKLYRVKSTVRKVRQGDKFYTYEVQEMELIEERWSSQKGEADNPRNPDSPINSITGAKLLKGVKKSNSNENILPESENVSFRVNENPTEAQKEAGNYKMGHLNLDGYRITIENPKGSVRRGTDSKGNAWENTLNNDYGYIRGTEGVDGDHIDVYLSDNPSEGNVFVIDQVNPQTREFDEHKVMYGFNSAEEAREAYLANFSEGWNGLGIITEVSKDEFKKWIQSSHRKTKPFSEYKYVNAIGMQSEEMSEEITTGTPTEDVVAEGVSLSPAQLASLAGDIFAALPEERRKKITDGLNGNILGLQDAILQIPTSLATKEEWNDEDKQMAQVVAEQMTKMVGKEMTRPFSASEALWTLYNAVNKSTDLVSEASRALVRRNLGFGLGQQERDSVQFRTSDSFESIDEIVENGKQKVSDENKTSKVELISKLNSINATLAQLRSITAAQRAYDKATVKIVTDLANELLEKGALSDMTRNEIKRLLSVIKDAVGKNDLTISVERLMDIMIANQLRFGRNRFEEFLKIRDKRVDARGIEVRGRLDVNGQMVMNALREGISLDLDRLEERIRETEDKLSDESETVRRNAENDLAGYELARRYLQEIKESEIEEKALRKDLKDAKDLYDAGGMSRDAYREFVKSTHDAIRENRMQRVNDYNNLLGDIAKTITEGVSRASLLRDAEKARIERIQHYANSDLQGKRATAHEQVESSFWNNPIVRLLTSPLATFEQWMRVFGQKSAEGKGYLYNHFVGAWNKANNEEYLGIKAAHEILDRKVRDVFGDEVKRWSDLFSIDKKMPKATVRMWDDGEMRDFEVTQGNLLYIYMVNKMNDGRMKLRKQGITEDDVNAIIRNMDPRFLELADWIQDEFLPGLRDKYNAVHERLFGAPMSAIENYFPIRVLANARVRDVELGAETGESKPSTITGSIIKRTKNSLALDVLGSNAFDVVLEHIEQMEHWAAFAEFNRDLNTLLSYRKFRNRVQNMSTALGSGKEAWNSFKETAEIVAGVYKPKTSKVDKALTNTFRGLTAGKISFRLWTALKQTLSMPAFLPYVNPAQFIKNLTTPWNAWKWAMEELPAFVKRWKSREAGNVRLKKTDVDAKIWSSDFMEIATRLGMTPNAAVDAFTCAVGAKSVYDTMYARYKGFGYTHEEADEKAKLDATVAFNATQQSSESAFVSAVQSDRTFIAHALTVFRNNSFGMGRELVDALRNTRDRMKRGYKGESIEFMKKQMTRDGLSEEQADKAAKRIYRNSAFKDAARIAAFGFGMQFLWNLGNSALYLLFGDDDEEKEQMIKDAALRGAFGSFEGLGFGNMVPEAAAMLLSGDIKSYNPSFSPAGSDIESLWNEMMKDPVAGASDLVNIIAQALIGTNPQVLADSALAIYDACNGDMELSKEVAIAIMRLLQAPQSSIDKIVMDEIDFSTSEGLDMTIEEFAKRYASYKRRRNAPYSFWAYSDEESQKIEDRYIKRFLKDAEAKKRTRGSEEAQTFYQYYDADYKKMTETLRDLRSKIKDAAKDEDIEREQNLVEQLDDFVETDEFKQFEDLLPHIKAYEAFKKAMKDAKTPEERKEYEQEMLKEMNAAALKLQR